ncbi:MAG: F0F1 ATP synthase subunit B' [Alphaproteobacteria bacterium]
MPQVDTTTFPSQIFWLIVLFAIFYWIVAKLILPRMTSLLELRQRTISGNLERAEAARAEAETVLAAYEQALSQARAQAHETLKAAHEAISAEAARREQEQAADIARRLNEAEQRIAEATAAARATVGEAIAEVTADVVGQISGKKPTAKQVEDAVAAAQASAG